MMPFGFQPDDDGFETFAAALKVILFVFITLI
jgi:hypothetical protein